jgi:hypothetical protein
VDAVIFAQYRRQQQVYCRLLFLVVSKDSFELFAEGKLNGRVRQSHGISRHASPKHGGSTLGVQGLGRLNYIRCWSSHCLISSSYYCISGSFAATSLLTSLVSAVYSIKHSIHRRLPSVQLVTIDTQKVGIVTNVAPNPRKQPLHPPR